MYDAANTPAANDQRARDLYAVIGKSARGEKLSDADVEAGIIGVATMINPAVGAMMAVGLGLLTIVESTAMAAFHALGWDAQGSSLADYQAHRCDNPPSEAQHQAAIDALAPHGPMRDPGMPWVTIPATPPDGPPGSFVAFAVPILRRNGVAYTDCRPAVEEWALLRQLALHWNNAHAGPQEILYLGQVVPGVMAPKIRSSGTWQGKAFETDTIDDPLGRGYITMNADGTNRDARSGFAPYPGDVPLDMQNLVLNMGAVIPSALPPPGPRELGKGSLHKALAGMGQLGGAAGIAALHLIGHPTAGGFLSQATPAEIAEVQNAQRAIVALASWLRYYGAK